eukprot:IDg21333t1
MSLDLAVVWPGVLTDSILLHKSWFDSDAKFMKNHPRVIAFRCFLRRLRTSNEEQVVSRCVIPLPFRVKTELQIAKRNTTYLKWSNSSAVVLYITLEAPDMNYLVDSHKTHTFKTV